MSLKYKNPQRRKNNLWHASHRTQRAIDRSEGVFVEYPVCEISVADLVAAVKRGLQQKEYIFFSVNCNTEFWSLSSE